MDAEIVSVGTELLLGQIVDTHASTMARLLAECGIPCHRRQTIGDNLERIVSALCDALSRADLVVTVGGLGPTADDLTRDAIAAALDDEMVYEPEVETKLREYFAARKAPWSDAIARQAHRPSSASLIENPNGTAPGLICEKDGKRVVALPGPKGEFGPMADGPVRRYLEGLHAGQVIHSRTLRICGMGESQVEAKVKHLMNGRNPTVAPYAHPGEVHLRVTAKAASREQADALIDPVHRQLAELLGDALYGIDDQTLEKVAVTLLVEANATVSVAESMTGGGLGERLTSVDGVSPAFPGGVIAYHVDAKEQLLRIDDKVLKAYGPVSREVAEQMALKARERLGTTYAISITGNAGPTSDVDGKPVGLVFVGVVGPTGCEVDEHLFRGQRQEIRRRGTQAALVALRRQLLSAAKRTSADG